MNNEYTFISGLNIQAPWSRLILDGQKKVETRSYPLPPKFLGQPLAIIETPGPKKLVACAQIVGVVWFSESFKYSCKKAWSDDYCRHLVEPENSNFGFSEKKPKYGWVIQKVVRLKEPLFPPPSRGIVFATKCRLPISF